MASWLVLLRSRLLLPAATAFQQAAEAEALRLRERLADLQAAQALAAWLDHRPLLTAVRWSFADLSTCTNSTR